MGGNGMSEFLMVFKFVVFAILALWLLYFALKIMLWIFFGFFGLMKSLGERFFKTRGEYDD